MPVQLGDLLAPHLDGVGTVIGVDDAGTAAAAAALSGLPLPAARPAAGDAAYGPGTLVVAASGPDPEIDPLAGVTGRLAPGARVLVLFDVPAEPVPLHRLRPAGPAVRLQLLVAGAVDADDVSGAALLTVVAVSEELAAEDAADDTGDTDGPTDVMSGAAATARYERALAGRDRRIRTLEARVQALETSATYVVGRTLVDAARNPKKARALPRELYGMWKSRSKKAGGGGGEEAAATLTGPVRGLAARPVSELDEVDAGLYLTHTAMAIGPRTVPVIAGMLTPATVEALRGPVEQPRAVVNTLLPHDGEAIVTRTDPDVVLIESAALGAPGPWAYTTQGAYGSRDQAVVDILTAARAMGRPVVVWWNSPAHATPGLNRIGAHADAVWTTAEWDPGRLAELSDRLNLGYEYNGVTS